MGCVVGLFALTGLTFDGGGKVRQAARADAVAREAARAACEQIDRLTVLRSGRYVLNRTWAQAAGADYVAQAGMQDYTLTFPARDVCQVTLTSDYKTKLLDLVGVADLPVTGTGQARFVYGVNGPVG